MLSRCDALVPFGQMDRFVNEFLGRGSTAWPVSPRRFPPINAWEDEGNFYVEADLPGFQLDDLEISVLGNELTVHGQRDQTETNGKTYHLRERATTEFTRVLPLPVEVAADKVAATLKDGVLVITLPKAETARPRKIAVQAG